MPSDRALAERVIGTRWTREALERAVLERVRLVAGLLQVALRERVLVDDDRRAALELADVRAQRGRVHRDQHVRRVARREDVARGEVDLERRDAGERAGRSADLGGEVGQRREVVAEHRGRVGEPAAGQLHAIAGVAGEPHDDSLPLLDALRYRSHFTPSSLRLLVTHCHQDNARFGHMVRFRDRSLGARARRAPRGGRPSARRHGGARPRRAARDRVSECDRPPPRSAPAGLVLLACWPRSEELDAVGDDRRRPGAAPPRRSPTRATRGARRPRPARPFARNRAQASPLAPNTLTSKKFGRSSNSPVSLLRQPCCRPGEAGTRWCRPRSSAAPDRASAARRGPRG